MSFVLFRCRLEFERFEQEMTERFWTVDIERFIAKFMRFFIEFSQFLVKIRRHLSKIIRLNFNSVEFHSSECFCDGDIDL